MLHFSQVQFKAASKLKGFSLIELLVVMAILGILAGLAMPLGETLLKSQRERELRQALWEIRSALDEYKRITSSSVVLPSDDASGYPPNLQALVDGLEDTRPQAKGQKIYFLRRIPRDPMADVTIAPELTWRIRSYASSADNPQPGADVYDVYSSSNEVALDGTPYAKW